MAVDTREKRASMVSWARPWTPQLPLPDTDINQGDRQHIAWVYRSVLDAPVVIVKCPPILKAADISPAIQSIGLEPRLAVLDLLPAVAAATITPGLSCQDISPDIFAEDCT